MSNTHFEFKQFCIHHDRCAMKVGTDGVLIGAWCTVDNHTRRVLDIGTGSGLIALMLAQRTESLDSEVCAIDIDAESCEQARENIAASRWCERIHTVHTSLQDFAHTTTSKFDLIVSNPPFFVDSLKAPDTARNNSRHCDTLTHEELLKYSSELLVDGGRLAVVLPSSEAEAMIHVSAVYGLIPSRICRVSSTVRKGEIRRLVEFVKTSDIVSCNQTTLCIHSGADYSEEYRALTADFYLKF